MRVVKSEVEIITNDNGVDILKRLEKIGRICYKSEDKITDDSYVNFIKGLIQRKHESVLEHQNITVKFIVDRGVSHEIVRHRLASYSQESTRYCDYSDTPFPVIDLQNGLTLDGKCSSLPKDKVDAIYNEWIEANLDAEVHYNNMIELGASPQIARSVLNNSSKTELYMTANLREWRHFLQLRTSKASHPQMREVAIQLLYKFKNFIPIVFNDIELDRDDLTKMSDDMVLFDDWWYEHIPEDDGQISIEEWMESCESADDINE